MNKQSSNDRDIGWFLVGFGIGLIFMFFAVWWSSEGDTKVMNDGTTVVAVCLGEKQDKVRNCDWFILGEQVEIIPTAREVNR